MLAIANNVIAAHVEALKRMLDNVEHISGDALRLTDARAMLLPQLEKMADVERALAAGMNDEERRQAKMGAEARLAGLRDRCLRLLPLIGANEFNDKEVAEIRRFFAGDPSAAGSTNRQLTYAVGFVVCHRKCCANHAGNGVAAGVGCWDCDDNVTSDSCPPV
jgi:hypothetical protein